MQTSTVADLPVIFSQIEELQDIRMPRLKVDGKCSRTFVPSLVNVLGGVVENTQHWDNAIAHAVGTRNVRATGANVVDVETDTASRLGNSCTQPNCVKDAFN